MKKFVLLAALISSVAFAQDKTWLDAAESDQLRDQFRIGSQRFVKNDGGEEGMVVDGRRMDKRAGTITFHLWFVTGADCRRGRGILTTTDLQGKVQDNSAWIRDGGNIGAGKAQLICDVYMGVEKARLDKSIPAAVELPYTTTPVPGVAMMEKERELPLSQVIMVLSEDRQWFRLTKLDGNEDWLRPKSSQIVTTNAGERVIKANGSRRFRGEVYQYQWYVRTKECNLGRGKLMAAEMSGKFLFEADFVNEGGTVASDIAYAVCAAYKGMVDRNEVS